jgi:hypothetical protein
MTGRRALLVALVLAVVAVVAVVAVAATAGAATKANSTAFIDPTGDSGNAPDVTAVTVSNDDAGTITFQITIANRPAFGPQDVLIVAMDTNGNLSDGAGGLDYVIGSNGSTALLASEATGSPVTANAPTLKASYTGGVVTISINRADLGNTAGLNFFIQGFGAPGAPAAENAPDGNGIWNYQVVVAAAPPPPTTPPPPPTTAPPPPPPPPLTLTALKVTAAHAIAGKPFTVSLLVRRNDTAKLLTGGQVLCAARLGLAPTPLRVAKKSAPKAGVATCTWNVPVTAHGKTIRGTITVVYNSVKVVRPFSAKVP